MRHANKVKDKTKGKGKGKKMALEIKVVRADGRRVRFGFVFAIPTPQADDAGNNKVLSPTADMDPDLLAMLDNPERNAANNGTTIVESILVNAAPGQTAAEILAVARAKYATRKAFWFTDNGTGQGEYDHITMFHEHVAKEFNEV